MTDPVVPLDADRLDELDSLLGDCACRTCKRRDELVRALQAECDALRAEVERLETLLGRVSDDLAVDLDDLYPEDDDD